MVRTGRHVAAGRANARSEIVKATRRIQDLLEFTGQAGTRRKREAMRCARPPAEFILEGLYAHKRISRNEEQASRQTEARRERPEEEIASEASIRGETGRRPPQSELIRIGDSHEVDQLHEIQRGGPRHRASKIC